MKLDLNNFDQVMDEAMKGRQGPLDEVSATDLMRQMMKRIYERALRGDVAVSRHGHCAFLFRPVERPGHGVGQLLTPRGIVRHEWDRPYNARDLGERPSRNRLPSYRKPRRRHRMRMDDGPNVRPRRVNREVHGKFGRRL